MVTTSPAAVRARALRLDGPRGVVFGPIDLDIPVGQASALVAPAHSGRTSLLLACAGRLAPTTGDLEVLGASLPRRRRWVQSQSALANFHGIDSPDQGLRVRELVNERAGLLVPMWRRPAWFGDPPVREAFRTVFGDEQAPDGDLQIWHLQPLAVARLRLVLALLGAPRLVVVDDVDSVRDPADQAALWLGFQRVALTGTTVIAATSASGPVPADIPCISMEAHS
jgi:hypothetical protein